MVSYLLLYLYRNVKSINLRNDDSGIKALHGNLAMKIVDEKNLTENKGWFYIFFLEGKKG